LVIDHRSFGAKLVDDAPAAVAWELGTQRPMQSRRKAESDCAKDGDLTLQF